MSFPVSSIPILSMQRVWEMCRKADMWFLLTCVVPNSFATRVIHDAGFDVLGRCQGTLQAV